MDGWWCVRHGDALAWVGASSAAAAMRRSFDLHPLGPGPTVCAISSCSRRTRTRTIPDLTTTRGPS